MLLDGFDGPGKFLAAIAEGEVGAIDADDLEIVGLVVELDLDRVADADALGARESEDGRTARDDQRAGRLDARGHRLEQLAIVGGAGGSDGRRGARGAAAGGGGAG